MHIHMKLMISIGPNKYDIIYKIIQNTIVSDMFKSRQRNKVKQAKLEM